MNAKLRIFGESSHQIDDAGRINIPKKQQPFFGQGGFLTRGINGKCLVFWSRDEWEELQGWLDSLKTTQLPAYQVKRYLYSGMEIELDKQGRLTVSQALRDFAELKKEIVLLGTGDQVEIWGKETWEAYNQEFLTPDTVAQAMVELRADEMPVAAR